MNAPAYCHNCGEAYPWASERLATARLIVQEEEQLDDELKKLFDDNIQDLVSERPRTQLAAQRVSKVLAKMAKPVAATVRGILIEIASETAKKIIAG